MTDHRAICDAARAARARGEMLFMATVVRAKGSSYRRPGARLLFASDRLIAGCISGGCLERDVLARGEYLTREGPAIVSYDSTSEDEVGVRTGLGCGGVVDVLVERIDWTESWSPLDFLERIVAAEQRGALAVVVRSRVREVPVGSCFALTADTRRASFRHAQAERELAVLAERVVAFRSQWHRLVAAWMRSCGVPFCVPRACGRDVPERARVKARVVWAQRQTQRAPIAHESVR